jgi:hypothetical protein
VDALVTVMLTTIDTYATEEKQNATSNNK